MKLKQLFSGINRISQEIFKDLSVINFYTMLRWYDIKSNNIAVINNRKAFNNIVKHYYKNINAKREDKVIKVNEDKYIFIINEIDRTIIYIDSLSELDNIRINFGKYV